MGPAIAGVGPCPKSTLEYVTPSEARGLGWWGQVALEEPRTRFLVASLLGMTVLGQSLPLQQKGNSGDFLPSVAVRFGWVLCEDYSSRFESNASAARAAFSTSISSGWPGRCWGNT